MSSTKKLGLIEKNNSIPVIIGPLFIVSFSRNWNNSLNFIDIFIYSKFHKYPALLKVIIFMDLDLLDCLGMYKMFGLMSL